MYRRCNHGRIEVVTGLGSFLAVPIDLAADVEAVVSLSLRPVIFECLAQLLLSLRVEFSARCVADRPSPVCTGPQRPHSDNARVEIVAVVFLPKIEP